MKRPWQNWLAATACVAVFFTDAEEVHADSFTVEEWFVSTHVHDSSSGEDDSSGFWTVQNPFQDSHSASVRESTGTASYDFAWADQFGAFLIDATHQAEGVPSLSLFASASGFIWITPSVDLSLSIAAEYTYSLPADPMLADLAVTVYDADDPLYELFGESENCNTINGAPASGTLAVAGQLTIPPNHTWILAYSMRLFTYSTTTGYMATGSGFVDFQITPEPATLCLLALGALGMLNRPRARRISLGVCLTPGKGRTTRRCPAARL